MFLSEEESQAFRQPVAQFLKSLPDQDDGTGATWSRMAQELGLLGVAVPEKFGGLGFSLPHAAVVSEELGRRLSGAPFLASAVLATSFLLDLADPHECEELLPDLIDGTCVATVAALEDDKGWAATTFTTTVTSEPGGAVLNGRKLFVLHGLTADLVLVMAGSGHDPGRRVLCLVRADADGLTRVPMSGLDPTRPVATLEFRNTPAQMLGQLGNGDVAPSLSRALARASVLLSAESIGAAAQCLELCVEYLKVRRQFGHAIGSFQAVQHRAADMYGELESARAAVEVAAGSVGDEDFAATAAVARARSADAFAMIARETIQLHGGIGFTWEHPAHRYYKRALGDLQFLGHSADQRRQLADHLAR